MSALASAEASGQATARAGQLRTALFRWTRSLLRRTGALRRRTRALLWLVRPRVHRPNEDGLAKTSDAHAGAIIQTESTHDLDRKDDSNAIADTGHSLDHRHVPRHRTVHQVDDNGGKTSSTQFGCSDLWDDDRQRRWASTMKWPAAAVDPDKVGSCSTPPLTRWGVQTCSITHNLTRVRFR